MYRRVPAEPLTSWPACFGPLPDRFEKRCPECGDLHGGWLPFGPGWRRCETCDGRGWVPVEGMLRVRDDGWIEEVPNERP